MARESGKSTSRLDIPYFQGLNSAVSYRLANKSEPVHMENARAPIIGVLEKREGQAKKGTASDGSAFTALHNYGIVNFPTTTATQQGVFRISEVGAAPGPAPAILEISVRDWIFPDDVLVVAHVDVDVVYDTGWVFPTDTGDKTAPDGYPWVDGQFADPTNGYADDGAYATCIDNAATYKGQSYYGFDFSTLTYANITGFEVATKGFSFGGVQGGELYLFNPLTPAVMTNVSDPWTTGVTTKTYGSSSTIPGGGSLSSWNVASFASTFYVVSSTSANSTTHTIELDVVKVKVYYKKAFPLQIHAFDGVIVTDPTLSGRKVGDEVFIFPTTAFGDVNIYALSDTNTWDILVDPYAQGLLGGQADFATVDGNLIIVDGNDTNRYIEASGTSLIDSTTAGHLYNSPIAHKVAFYKNRIYLADYYYGEYTAIRYPTSVVRSSYPVGIVGLVNEDVGASGYLSGTADAAVTTDDTYLEDTRLSLGVDTYVGGVVTCNGKTMTVTSNTATKFTGTAWSGGGNPGDGESWSVTAGSTMSIPLTDTKYIYATTGMNEYDIYRGNTYIGMITVTTVKEASVLASTVGFALAASDEVWVHDTYNGVKQYRWQANPTASGKDVKQYDTMKLSGGDEDAITLLETVGNILMVGNKNTLMTWNDYNFENIDLRVGSVSTNGYIKHLGALYFLHYTGVYATTGAAPTLLSRKVDRYIRGATKAGLEASCAGYKGLSVFFTLGDVTLYNNDGSTWKVLHNTCLEYHTGNKDWYVHTNVPAEEFETFMDTAGAEHLLMEHTGTDKYVKEFLTGSTDDGTEIFFRVDTQVLPLMNEFEWYINPTSIVLETDRGTNMKCFISPDEDQEFYQLRGTISKGVTILKANATDDDTPSPVLGRHIRLSFRDGSKQLCRLVQVSVLFLPTQQDFSE